MKKQNAPFCRQNTAPCPDIRQPATARPAVTRPAVTATARLPATAAEPFPVTRRQTLLTLLALFGPARFAPADGPPGETADGESALHSVSFREAGGTQRRISGRILVKAADGGLLVEDRAGRLWTITSGQLIRADRLAEPFSPLAPKDLAAALIAELNDAGDFGSLTPAFSEHYVAVSSTGRACVDWTLTMLERLHGAFRSYWSRQDFETHDAGFPLPVVILQSRKQFGRLATYDRTPASAQGQGYFLVTANRITLVDLTADEAASRARTVGQVQKLVRRNPASVTTVVHEATHQIAFNCGMHRRYADNPVWLTEGVAMHLETPDLTSRRGWRTMGRVNRNRLRHYREFSATRRQADSLQTLLRSNDRFSRVATAVDAYSEAWALTHFLIRTRPRDFTAYLRTLIAKPRLQWDTPEQRMADFTAAFGTVSDVDRDLQRYLRRLR